MTGDESNNNQMPHNPAKNDMVNTYRENTLIGYKITNEYRNGNRQVSIYTTCDMCYDNKKCSYCHGLGSISSFYGSYPCGVCGQTGICNTCKDNNGYILSSSFLYSSNRNLINTDGSARSNGGAVYSGGSGYNDGSSSNSGSDSSRYGYYSCPTCYGSGTCHPCGVDGVTSRYFTGVIM